MRWIVAAEHGGLPFPVASSARNSETSVGPDGERVGTALGEKGPVLQQVGAVGVERVAREPTLELQVGEKVEHQALEAGARP